MKNTNITVAVEREEGLWAQYKAAQEAADRVRDTWYAAKQQREQQEREAAIEAEVSERLAAIRREEHPL